MPPEFIYSKSPANEILFSYVYKSYEPQRIGKIVGIDPINDRWEVLWQDGSYTKEIPGSLKSFDGLIADHEKKLNTHKTNLLKAKLVIG